MLPSPLINNLLTAVIGAAEHIEDALGPDHELWPTLDVALSATAKAAALTGQLLAFARKQTLAPQTLDAVAAEPALELVFVSGSSGKQLLTIASRVLAARIAGEQGRWEEAIPLLEESVVLQDALPYTEPPPWYFPNREALGHALLQAGRADEAEAVFAKQLAYTPRNGWSLFGLAASQRAQGDLTAARSSDTQLAEVWERADFQLEAAVF